ncbi:predicted protein [Plenodomus lingam JN3]|uniref:Predicted protein n=1 Tax=Leptosphaeria maculans (strain JN3 / isolate v23.1.3 / race Av1-4-5-6-7-8) TaxID=985895 RepID=E5R490_LEPMJ|nr:predicted protein [Plenodomus lingam JN3]CBX91858.1 predicted protein [Plenodomus lingam JN3]
MIGAPHQARRGCSSFHPAIPRARAPESTWPTSAPKQVGHQPPALEADKDLWQKEEEKKENAGTRV